MLRYKNESVCKIYLPELRDAALPFPKIPEEQRTPTKDAALNYKTYDQDAVRRANNSSSPGDQR